METMGSLSKIQVKRQKATLSTGPRTPEGKAKVRHNATKHGLLSQEILLPDEDPDALEELGARLRAAWQPVGEQEELFLDLMIAALWKMRRLSRVEAGVFAAEYYEVLTERAAREVKALEQVTGLWNPVTITDRGQHEAAAAKAARARAHQETETSTLGLAFIQGSSGVDVFSKLARYAVTHERSFYRALHELQRCQHARRGGNVPPPLAVDVQVSGVSGDPG